MERGCVPSSTGASSTSRRSRVRRGSTCSPTRRSSRTRSTSKPPTSDSRSCERAGPRTRPRRRRSPGSKRASRSVRPDLRRRPHPRRYDAVMDRLFVTGGARLAGSVRIAGAKNSALKLMAASLMVSGRSVLHNVPRIQDCVTMGEVLEHLGAHVMWSSGSVTVDATELSSVEAPYELVRRMRASIVVLGPLLARTGEARVAMPGGDNIGSRAVDLHPDGLRRMGAEIESEHGFLVARSEALVGSSITLDYPSVGATENLLMAAAGADGLTVIDNAAREPEITDLAAFLVAMGAEIRGAGSATGSRPGRGPPRRWPREATC